MKKLLITSMLSCLLAGSLLTTSPVSAATNQPNQVELNNSYEVQLDDSYVDNLKSILDEQGIDKETQKELIQKKINGEIWDAENPEKLEQVPENFYMFDMSNPFEEKIYTFDDGSIIKLSHSRDLTQNKNLIQNRIITESPYATEYRNEAMTATYGAMRVTIYVNCGWYKGAAPRINDFSDSNMYPNTIGGNTSTTNMNIENRYATPNYPALAVGKVTNTNDYAMPKTQSWRAEFQVYTSYGTTSFKLVKQ